MTEFNKALEQLQSGSLPQNVEVEQDGVSLNPDQVSQSRSAMLQWLMTAGLLGQAVKIRKLLELRSFKGETDPRTVTATEDAQEIATMSWVNAFIINYGPNTAYVAFNTPHFWLEIRPNQTRMIDRKGAEQKIERIFCRCVAGGTASLVIDGEY